MASDHPSTRPGLATRLRSIARTTAALVLLAGGVLALLGWLATTGDGAWDVLGVILLLLALFPTITGLLGLFAAQPPDAHRGAAGTRT